MYSHVQKLWKYESMYSPIMTKRQKLYIINQQLSNRPPHGFYILICANTLVLKPMASVPVHLNIWQQGHLCRLSCRYTSWIKCSAWLIHTVVKLTNTHRCDYEYKNLALTRCSFTAHCSSIKSNNLKSSTEIYRLRLHSAWHKNSNTCVYFQQCCTTAWSCLTYFCCCWSTLLKCSCQGNTFVTMAKHLLWNIRTNAAGARPDTSELIGCDCGQQGFTHQPDSCGRAH